MVTTINSTVTTEVESRTSESEPQSASAPSPSSLDAFEGVGYGLSVPSGWFHDEVDEFSSEGGFYTNIWREPRDPESTYVRVDGGNAEPAADPISASEGLVNQLREASDYREYFYGPELLDGRETARWVFSIDGDKRVDYFFTECGQGLAVVGSTVPARFPELQPMFRSVAKSAAVHCGP